MYIYIYIYIYIYMYIYMYIYIYIYIYICVCVCVCVCVCTIVFSSLKHLLFSFACSLTTTEIVRFIILVNDTCVRNKSDCHTHTHT